MRLDVSVRLGSRIYWGIQGFQLHGTCSLFYFFTGIMYVSHSTWAFIAENPGACSLHPLRARIGRNRLPCYAEGNLKLFRQIVPYHDDCGSFRSTASRGKMESARPVTYLMGSTETFFFFTLWLLSNDLAAPMAKVHYCQLWGNLSCYWTMWPGVHVWVKGATANC